MLALTLGTTMVSGIAQMAMADAASSRISDPLGGLRTSTSSTTARLPVVYGEVRLAGNTVFMEAGGADNRDLWVVDTLAAGPCDSATSIWLDSEPYEEARIVEKWLLVEEVAWAWFHGGSWDQTVDGNLSAAVPGWTDCLRGTAYMVYRLRYHSEAWTRVPAREVLVRGRQVLDPRTGQTAWSANPALVAYDYLRDSVDGLGMGQDRFDAQAVVDCANYCDARGWRVDGALPGANGQNNLNYLLQAGRLNLAYDPSGIFRMQYEDTPYEAVSMVLTSAHSVAADNGGSQVRVAQPGRFDVPDGVKIQYANQDTDYSVDEVPVGETMGSVQDYTLLVSSKSLAMQHGMYLLERSRLNRTITGVFTDECMRLEPGDLVNFSCDGLPISGQLMRVREVNLQSLDGPVALHLAYESDALYDAVLNLVPEDVYTCSLPDPTAAPPDLGPVTLTSDPYDYNQRRYTRLQVDFATPTWAWFEAVKVERSFDLGETWTWLFDVAGPFALDPVEIGKRYRLRLTPYSRYGVPGQATVVEQVIGDNSTGPDSVGDLRAMVSDSDLLLYATTLNSPEIRGYEVRLGPSFAGGVFLAANDLPSFSWNGVKPGSHTFWINTLDNRTPPRYGAQPRSTTVHLVDPPPGLTVTNSFAADYTGGTYDNTEVFTYGSVSALRRVAGTRLDGTYLGPVYDAGSIGRFQAYALAALTVTGQGTRWIDAADPGTPWNEIVDPGTPWTTMFALSNGPQVQMRLRYSETNAAAPEQSVDGLEILMALVTGRYFQIEITVLDPNPLVQAVVQPYTLKLCAR